MLQLDSITKTFGDRVLFRDVSLHLKSQMRLGLIGANGVGKTTLFRILLGDESISEGRIQRRGGLQMGYVPQEVEILSGLGVLAETLTAYPELEEVQQKLNQVAADLDREPGSKTLLKQLGRLQDQFEELDGYQVETRAKTILSGLGFPEHRFRDSLDTLSGGWKMRVALAKVLLRQPNILLLDEPTNHLDLESLIWLEKFLADYEGAMVIISHDRTFLDNVTTHTAEVIRQSLTVFTGTYSKFEEFKTTELDMLRRQAQNQAKQIAQAERFIERFRAKNTLATRVKSKIKQLEKIDRIELPDDEQKEMFITIPPPPRSGLKVAVCSSLRKAYGENVVYDSLEYTLERGDKVALVGPNGAGKSTLLKLLAGVILQYSGELTLGHHVSRWYYAQHQLEALDPEKTVYDSVLELSNELMTTQLRTYLGTFLFSGDDHFKKVQVLSGGEKARLALSRLFIQPANLLLFDEPTNHLDITSQDVLIRVLQEYTGTMVCISHDRRFINAICNKVVAVSNGSIAQYPGNYDYYIWKRDQQKQEVSETAEASVSLQSEQKLSYEARKSIQKEERRRQRKIEKLAGEIESLEGRIKALDLQMADPEMARDYVALQDLMDEKEHLNKKLDETMDAWVAAQE